MPAAKAPATVTLRLASDPAGSKIFTAEGNEMLGTTPFSLKRPKGGALKVRLEKDGYTPATREVPLDEDQSLEFALERKPEPVKPKLPRKPHGGGSSDSGPAKL